MIPKRATVDENLRFDAATPMFEGYNGRAKWFGLAEFVSMVGLALAEFLGNVVSVEKSCVTHFAVLVVTLGAYFFICIYFRPFQELFNRRLVPIITLCEVVIVGLAYFFGDNPPDFIVTLAVLTSSMQSVMAVIVVIASLSPLSKHIIRAWKRFVKRSKENNSSKNNNNKKIGHSATTLRNLLLDENIGESVNSSRRHLFGSVSHSLHQSNLSALDPGSHGDDGRQGIERVERYRKVAIGKDSAC